MAMNQTDFLKPLTQFQMTSFLSLSKKRPGTTLAGIFSAAAGSVLLLCGAGVTPTGNMQTADINANGFSLTNAATVSAANIVVTNSLAAPDAVTPEQYGGKADGKMVTDVASTSGSGVVTSASAAFTSSDAGKAAVLYYGHQVRLDGCGTTSGSATVSVSSTAGIVPGMYAAAPGIAPGSMVTAVGTGSVTISANATATATVHVDFAANYLLTTIASYQSATQVTLAANATLTQTGARFIYGTDNTVPIQSAINAVASATQGSGTVRFRAGMYLVTGALQNASQQNSVLTLPNSGPVLTAIAFRPA
jgi:hypothetical protein